MLNPIPDIRIWTLLQQYNLRVITTYENAKNGVILNVYTKHGDRRQDSILHVPGVELKNI